MTSNLFNEIHLAEFLKLSPPHAVGRVTEAWDGGKQPGSWFAAVGYTSPFIASLSPQAKFTRSAVQNVIRNERVSDADVSMLIFAWGGMAVKNAKLIVGSKNHWVEIVSGLRSEKLMSLEAYDRFLAQSLRGNMPGCGPAFYTKLIFFLTKHLDQRGFIMDQWLTGQSIYWQIVKSSYSINRVAIHHSSNDMSIRTIRLRHMRNFAEPSVTSR